MRLKIVIFLLFSIVSLTFSLDILRGQQNALSLRSMPMGLYNASDEVVEFTSENFDQYIYGNKRAYLVEFYNTWCGHCQRFAPTYKKIAEFFKYSKDIFVIAAVDCANDINQPLCRNFEIMGYPTLKYFHEDYTEGATNLGMEVDKTDYDNVDGNIEIIINVLLSEQAAGRAEMLPNLTPCSDMALNELRGQKSFAFLLRDISDDVSLSGVKTLMTLHRVPDINVRYSNPNPQLDSQEIKAITREGQVDTIPKVTSPVAAIRDYMKSHGIDITKYIIVEQFNLTEEQDNEDETNQDVPVGSLMEDAVFQMDLESALRYSLREIGRTKLIEGEKLIALKNYLGMIHELFPIGFAGKEFLKALKDHAFSQDSVHGMDIFKMTRDSEAKNRRVWSTEKNWAGCKGSKPGYRGYPCGLWKLFHYLSVNSNDGKTLKVMHGYIKNFFGCADCSQHFQDMSERNGIWNVSNNPDDSILWLWSAHNEVNARLSGDVTEDPAQPKIQFPSVENCPECYNINRTWNKRNVVTYLKGMYSVYNIRYYGADMSMLVAFHPMSGSGIQHFNIFDESMLIVSFFVSFLLLIVIFRMFLKRGYRKKVYVHDLSGKV